MINYSFQEIEEKWQNIWEENKAGQPDFSKIEKKFYNLTMFSYPSGDKLHVGHWYNYGPADTYARYMKMRGYNVFQPQGFDAFGLPAENYAIKHGVHPAVSTAKNIETMRKQLRKIGAMYDWSNEINTSSPDYYKWTQWLFLKLYEKGLAYQKKAPVNWCPSCVTVLANEQVKEEKCERCGTEVTKKDLKQWFFKITDYAEELLQKLDELDWPDRTKHMQRHWIGKSVGASIKFKVKDHNKNIDVFTTRSDTIFGATYMVLAPEHEFVQEITTEKYKSDVNSYILVSKSKTEIERTSTDREKTGVFTGAYAINPLNQKEIPIWIGDYVVSSYGTGAIMAVPSGDERDFEFATKFNLPILEVVSPDGKLYGNEKCFSEYGISVNSGEYSGKQSKDVIKLVDKKLSELEIGGSKIQYKLHDWLISRQRYWGAPIPVVYCNKCGTVPVPVKELPVKLPEDIELSETYGEDVSPLAKHREFMDTDCPNCGANAKRDPDTMDTFVCSSWYFLRYPNANFNDGAFDEELLNWLPVDQYIGGAEHATMHLLYARFVTKALRDAGYLNFDEPFRSLYHQGTITKDGAKMSKSRGNTVAPDEFIEKYGSDTFRAYLMFMGPFDEGGDWNDKGITGIYRFLNKVWRLTQLPISEEKPSSSDIQILHYTIKEVTNDLSNKKFNTAISRLMEFVNHHSSKKKIDKASRDTLIQLTAPIAPHLSEELWSIAGYNKSVFDTQWPGFDSKLIEKSTLKIAIQVNGKLRDDIEVDKSISKEDLLQLAKSTEKIKGYLAEKNIIKEIVVPGRLINIVLK
ncbi:MAG: leucine--tRNA ligase [Candidatus Marinimicrobia bacterium]|nr:leucine--tRNA ligase [Candidatus Neomarinimicrobiota bacterium]MBL7023028.1 leucine--tRNA ligase [Candidatus Neomarinimicrobiota bacterium]